MLSRPDVLVLGGGGVLGETWLMGALAGIEDATGLDLRGCEYFVGTSAGSIVAAHLVAGRRPRRPTGGATERSSPAHQRGESTLRPLCRRGRNTWRTMPGESTTSDLVELTPRPPGG